ncbi:MAG: T9SS type A sorting domain-containing protein [Sphingobacteriaceae bacterium]|nr:T9SS type A sorting domain-containing protein [Sphingobacteriaceae bacterium]
MKKGLLFVLSICYFSSFSQEWTANLDSNANFYDIKAAFENYWKDKTPERGQGYKQMQRWIWAMEPRVYPSGDLKNVSAARDYAEYKKYKESFPAAKQISSAAISATTANWTALGPFGSASNTGAGRLQCVRFHPAGTNTVFVGAASGGLWKSTNGGTSWTTSTDDIASLGVSDVVVNPSNNNIIYISTGDFDGAPSGYSGGDSKSVGVLKSTDAGVTWNATGLNWTTSQDRFISKLLMNPSNNNELFAFTSVGIYRTQDAAATWSLIANGYFKDGEYKPGDPTVIYAANGNTVLKSTNGGASFAGTTFNASGIGQIRIAVTAANPNYLYIVGTSGTNAFGRLVRSTDAAGTFSTMSTTPNILGGTQGWYDLSIAANPFNANDICVGGIDVWRSTNGGSSWIQKSFAYTAGPYVHPDQHDAIYSSSTTIWVAHDGGVDRSTNSGSTWTSMSGNMNISQPYYLGVSATSPTRIVAGLQDNGSIVYNGTNWFLGKGGDGMDCFIDWNNPNIIVASSQNGGHGRSTNGGANFSNIVSGLSGTANWVSPICQDPNVSTTYYAGRQHVFRSTNSGSSWSQFGTLPGSGDVLYINPAPSNPSVIYAGRGTAIYKTINGGTTWSAITGTIPVVGKITDIEVENGNANHVYLTLSGYVAGNKVFFSNDGGATWTNISAGLPNLPANCIVYRKNSPGGIYVGMDHGIYYRESSMSSFIPYDAGLPNVWVNDMEIYYPTGKLRAATYGRGMWETNLYSNPTAPPSAYFSNNFTSACINVPFVFNDQSANTPVSWSWSFPGGVPATSTAQNPVVTYAATGVYTVTLISTNGNGPSTPYTSTIMVNTTPTISSSNPSVCVGSNTNIPVSTNGIFVNWSTGFSGPSLNLIAVTTSSVYSYTVSLGACTVASTSSLTVWPVPASPVVSTNGNSLTTASATTYQWLLNGTPIPGATNQDYLPSSDGWYSVDVTNSFGCSSSGTSIYISITALASNEKLLSGIRLSPNPAKDILTVTREDGGKTAVNYEVISIVGQKVLSGTLKFDNSTETPLNIQVLAPGTYIIKLNASGKAAAIKFIKE